MLGVCWVFFFWVLCRCCRQAHAAMGAAVIVCLGVIDGLLSLVDPQSIWGRVARAVGWWDGVLLLAWL